MEHTLFLLSMCVVFPENFRYILLQCLLLQCFFIRNEAPCNACILLFCLHCLLLTSHLLLGSLSPSGPSFCWTKTENQLRFFWHLRSLLEQLGQRICLPGHNSVMSRSATYGTATARRSKICDGETMALTIERSLTRATLCLGSSSGLWRTMEERIPTDRINIALNASRSFAIGI